MTTQSINKQSLEALESKLWEIISKRSLADDSPPPHIDTLFENDACEMYSSDLNAYAHDVMNGNEGKWRGSPLLEHLGQCPACRRTLKEITVNASGVPYIRQRSKDDLDITLFYESSPQQERDDNRGEVHIERPRLLGADFIQVAGLDGWFFTLEQVVTTKTNPGGLLLSLISPDGEAANVAVRIVLLGRILHGVTDEQGQILFQDVFVPQRDQPFVPAVNIHLDIPF